MMRTWTALMKMIRAIVVITIIINVVLLLMSTSLVKTDAGIRSDRDENSYENDGYSNDRDKW